MVTQLFETRGWTELLPKMMVAIEIIVDYNTIATGLCSGGFAMILKHTTFNLFEDIVQYSDALAFRQVALKLAL